MSEKNILGANLVHEERLRSLTRMYTTVDRMLTGRHITVKSYTPGDSYYAEDGSYVSDAKFPVTDLNTGRVGEEIVFNASRLTDADLAHIETLHGLNYHEVARSEFSMKWETDDKGDKAAFKILEANRVDNLFVAEHQATGPWMSAAVMRWMTEVQDPGEVAKLHLSTHGREFLPPNVRQAAAEMFEASFGDEARAEFEDVIDTYNDLILPRDFKQAQELAKQYDELCHKYFNQSASQQPDPFDSAEQGKNQSTPTQPQRGNAGQQKAQSQRQENDDDPDEGDDADGEGDGGGGEGEGEGEGGQGDGQDGEQQQGDGKGKGQGKPQKQQGKGDGQGQGGDGQGDGQGQGKGGQGQPSNQPSQDQGDDGSGEGDSQAGAFGPGAGNHTGTHDIRDPREAAQRSLDHLLASDEISQEIERTRNQVFRVKSTERIPQSPFSDVPVPNGLLSASRQFERYLKRLKQAVEPGWVRRTDTGRVNASRLMRERNIDTAFDAWDEGQEEAVDIEVVILVDESGSMNNAIQTTVGAMWGIKRALDQVGASTTVIMYDGSSEYLYKPKDKAKASTMRFRFRGGGTNPTEAVRQAAMILTSSKRAIKIFIILTDGDWYCGDFDSPSDPEHPDQVISRMGKAGYITALGHIHNGYGSPSNVKNVNHHGCEIAQVLDAAVLPAFGRAIVNGAIAKRLVRR